jgi:predicted  nucleic acid-binding Zn-ribbon protein
MIITKLFVILLTILIILHIVKKFNDRYKKSRYLEGVTTMTDMNNMNNSNSENNTLKYTDTGLGNDPLFLAKTNAANIAYMKSKVDELIQLKEKVADIDNTVKQNTDGITNISQQLSSTADQLVGRDPNSTEPIPQVTGLD